MTSLSVSVPAAVRPRAQDFALLFGLESAVRGVLLSAVPLVMYRLWGEGTVVSAFFLLVGLGSLAAGLLVPWATRVVGRARMMVGAGGLYLLGAGLLLTADPWLTALAMLVNAVATVTFWICLSAYVLDHVAREDLARNETLRLVYSATAWTVGPFAGVLLLDWWRPAPFLLAAGFAVVTTGAFLRLDLGDGKAVGAAGTGRPLAYLRRFVRRPRLVAGWAFAVIRSCGWWVYIVYLPLFCLESGIDERVGGAAVSVSNGMLFATPLMLRLVGRWGVRGAVRATFGWCAALFMLAALVAGGAPWAAVGALVLASSGLVMLDVCGSLPFLMAVKPSERTEMAAVYSSFRDVSGILSPAVGGLVLVVAPVAATFAVTGAAMAAAWGLAATVHPRLGARRGP
ncbi:MFS transporter [Rubellimicrobium roseum]|uniref:MFS transporter n=1 Tax=Rubellimicrobium roseum TaxID=687525 RepID=A0A5C4NAW3_9RHOB|nr:MFS transporter [Rubellimicrobium roseum]TNC70316.1 MFS transporter [Rubellimicrobium roseum]